MSSQELAMNQCKNLVYSSKFESFGLVDGPGVRSIIFLSGCPFKCLYCHNVEMQDFKCGKPISVDDTFNKLIRYKNYWKDNGGVTISGGEPLCHIDFLIELGKKLKERNISYVIDTSLATFSLDESFLKKFDELLSLSILFLVDIKAINNNLHKQITGKVNKNVLEGIKYLNDKNFPIWIRYVLVPSLTDKEIDLIKTRDFIKTLNNVERVEVLPYHTLALPKYEKLHIDYLLKGTKPPSKEAIEKAKEILEVSHYNKWKAN